MHPYNTQQLVPIVQAERRRQAPLRHTRRDHQLTRRAGAGLVAVGTALASTGRRLQQPAPGSSPAAC